MISRLYAAWLACVAVYQDLSAFDQVVHVGPDTIGLKVVAGVYTVTIQGTTDKAMWESNFEVLPTTDPLFGEMHTGFLMSARAIHASLSAGIVAARAQGIPVAICGHSRGGSLADVLASLVAEEHERITLFMFEAAPVGKEQYRAWCRDSVALGDITVEISTVNGLDPVPYSDDVLGYVSTYETENLNFPPGRELDLLPFSWHMEDVIYRGMQAKYPQG